jgi:CRISPR-associated endonuclease Csn1
LPGGCTPFLALSKPENIFSAEAEWFAEQTANHLYYVMSATPQGNAVWAFDLGKGSIGEAVRVGESFPHIESWLIPEDMAQRGPATKSGTPASRYRAMKTREAHRAREDRLHAICADAGIETLAAKRVARDPHTKRFHIVQTADPRLTREFPKKGDDTCYTSCLLRIKLLRGHKLEGWQVYKALHSAIQRRGYDADLAWKHRSRNPNADKEEGDTAQRAGAYREALTLMASTQPEFHGAGITEPSGPA